jgi:hypothetical protein
VHVRRNVHANGVVQELGGRDGGEQQLCRRRSEFLRHLHAPLLLLRVVADGLVRLLGQLRQWHADVLGHLRPGIKLAVPGGHGVEFAVHGHHARDATELRAWLLPDCVGAGRFLVVPCFMSVCYTRASLARVR